MFKSMLRAGLTAALIMGMVATSFAYDLGKGLSVNGSFREYLGHYNVGKEGYSNRFENRGEANIGFQIAKKFVSAFMEIEVRDFDSAKGAPSYVPELKNPNKPLVVSAETRNQPYIVQRWVQFQAGKASLKIGTILNTETLGFTVLGGTRTFSMHSMGGTGGGALANFAEGDGVKLGLNLSNVQLGITLLTSEVTIFNHVAPGKTLQFTLGAKLGGLKLKAVHTTFTADDYMDNDVANITDTGQLLGIRFPYGKKVVLSFDYSRTEYAKDSALRAVPFALTGLGVPMDIVLNSKAAATTTMSGQILTKGVVGYGGLLFTYGTASMTVEGEKVAIINDINIVYDMPLELTLKSGLQFTFLQRHRDVPESYQGNDGLTESYTSQFIGAGIYAYF